MEKVSITEKKSFLKYKKSKKRFSKKINTNVKHNSFPLIVIYLLLFIGFIIICLTLIYFLIHKKKPDDSNVDPIIESYIKIEKDFCDNPDKYKNQKYEDDIALYDVKLNDLKYQMYLSKSHSGLQSDVKNRGYYEKDVSNNMIEALKFYASKNNKLDNKDIFMLDIGGNHGWYPSLLGRYGYTILTFEALERNYYVSNKNYCLLNKDSNVIIIRKGLGAEEKKCNYFKHQNNEGNGMVLCDNKDVLNDKGFGKSFIKDSEVEITTLNTFMPYLYNKNIALMKLDVEGHELKVLEGGKELITKYHVPFVVLEYSPGYLKEVGSEAKDLAQLFVDNGYKISTKGFLSKEYITIDELLNKPDFQFDCYFIHESITNILK
jgi:FkbM family methyltransferase